MNNGFLCICRKKNILFGLKTSLCNIYLDKIITFFNSFFSQLFHVTAVQNTCKQLQSVEVSFV